MTAAWRASIIGVMSEHPPHIVFAEAYDQDAIESMRAVGRVTVLPACDGDTLRAAVADCDALLVRSYAIIDNALLAHAKTLRVIGRGGVGLDNIDVEAARRRNIEVVYAPAAATDAVADLTIGLMIALTRNLRASDQAVRDGAFLEARERTRSRVPRFPGFSKLISFIRNPSAARPVT